MCNFVLFLTDRSLICSSSFLIPPLGIHNDLCFLYFRIPTSSPLGDPTMASTAALLGLHSRPELPPNHPLSPTYLGLHSSPTSSLRLQLPPSHADYLSAAATAQRLGELQQAAQASIDVPFSLDGKL